MKTKINIFAAAILCAGIIAPGVASSANGDGLRQLFGGFGQVFSGFGNGLRTVREDLSRGAGIIGEDFGAGLAQLGGRLSGGFLFPTEGAESFETAVEHQGLGRRVVYIRPQTLSDEPAPAVVMLHFGRTGTAERMANLVRAGRLAAEFGVWVILPEAVNSNWNENPTTADSNDDSGFLVKVIEQASEDYPIDPERVFMAGMSNGGFMATRFVCEHPGVVAGMALTAASMRVQQNIRCPAAAPVPVLLMLGDSDIVVPYQGRIGLLSARESFVRWAENNGCDFADETRTERSPVTDDGTEVFVDNIRGCDADSAVRLVTIEGGGHAWPGSMPLFSLSSLGRISENLDATLEIWDFFQNVRRP